MLFIVFPTDLLILYPTRVFRKCISIVLVSVSLFFAIVRPYKVNYFNAINSTVATIALQSLIIMLT